MSESAPELPLHDERSPKGVAWDGFKRYLHVARQEDGIISVSHAARALGISPATVDVHIRRGRLELFTFPEFGMRGVSARQVKAFASERRYNRGGRGMKVGVAGTGGEAVA